LSSVQYPHVSDAFIPYKINTQWCGPKKVGNASSVEEETRSIWQYWIKFCSMLLVHLVVESADICSIWAFLQHRPH